MPANDIGIDMGTSSCLVYSTAKGLVLKEPTVVVYDKDTEEIPFNPEFIKLYKLD